VGGAAGGDVVEVQVAPVGARVGGADAPAGGGGADDADHGAGGEADAEVEVELVRGLAGRIEPVGRALPGEAVPGRAQADVLWCPGSTRLSRAELEGAPRLRWIGDTSGGPPYLDYHYAARRGLAVTDCRRAFAPAVGEMALALYLAVLRDVVVHDRALHTPEGTEGAEKATNREASGRTIGLVGYGGIARALHRLLAPFEPRLLIHDPYFR
jgi:phosphoglycerate dehydrogenase-like enzyme